MASNNGSEFKEMRLLSSPEVETEPHAENAGKKVCIIMPFRTTLERVLAILALILLVVSVVLIALLVVKKGKQVTNREDNKIGKFEKDIKGISSTSILIYRFLIKLYIGDQRF